MIAWLPRNPVLGVNGVLSWRSATALWRLYKAHRPAMRNLRPRVPRVRPDESRRTCRSVRSGPQLKSGSWTRHNRRLGICELGASQSTCSTPNYGHRRWLAAGAHSAAYPTMCKSPAHSTRQIQRPSMIPRQGAGISRRFQTCAFPERRPPSPSRRASR